MEHRIVNGLHIVDRDGHISVYTEQEYLEIQNSWWNRAKETLTSLGAGASWAIKH